MLVMWAILLIFLGLYIPYFYIEIFSIRKGIMNSEDTYLNKYLIIFLNVGSFFGRLVSVLSIAMVTDILNAYIVSECSSRPNRASEHHLPCK